MVDDQGYCEKYNLYSVPSVILKLHGLKFNFMELFLRFLSAKYMQIIFTEKKRKKMKMYSGF